MGHSLVGELPRTLAWRRVVGLIAGNAAVAIIAAESTEAAEIETQNAASDAVLGCTFWLMTQIPVAAAADNFPEALSTLGIKVSQNPSLPEICCALLAAVDEACPPGRRRSDLGEMAELSAVEALMAVAGPSVVSIFGEESAGADTQRALRTLSTGVRFGAFARDFFARLTARILAYYLSRTLGQHVGVGRRFRSVREHRNFELAVSRHCREAAAIVEDFSGSWFSARDFGRDCTKEQVAKFLHGAVDKLRNELLVRRG